MQFTTSIYIVILSLLVSMASTLAAPLALHYKPSHAQQILIGAPVAIGFAGLAASWGARSALLDVNKITKKTGLRKISAAEYSIIFASLPLLAAGCIVSKNTFAIKWLLPPLIGLQGFLLLLLLTDDMRIIGITVDFMDSILDDIGDDKWQQISDILDTNKTNPADAMIDVINTTKAKEDMDKFVSQMDDMNVSADTLDFKPSVGLSILGVAVVIAAVVGTSIMWRRVLPLTKAPR